MCVEVDLLPSTLERSLGVCVGVESDPVALSGMSYCKQGRSCLCVKKDMSRTGVYVLCHRSVVDFNDLHIDGGDGEVEK